jgi:ATP-dependent Clp protease, protease subunit
MSREILEEEEKPAKQEPKSDNLGQKLLDSRVVLVTGPVNDKMYESVVARLLFLQQKDDKAEITVVVNSPGGSADGGFGIYDVMKYINVPIRTVCAGLCASAGVLIYLGGTRGNRFTLPNSRFLLHQPSTQAFGQASDMEITAQEIIRTRKKYAGIVGNETNLDAEKVEADSNRDFWLTAEQAVKYGLADKIIKSITDIK